MKLLIFQNPYEIFQFFLHSWKYRFWKKLDYNRAAISLITRKILVCDVEYCKKKTSIIRIVMFTLKNFQKRKINWKNSYGFWKSNKKSK